MTQLHGGFLAAVAVALTIAAQPIAQTGTPYKLGMFDQNGRAFVGLVIQKDSQVVDLSRANVGAPATLKQLVTA